MGLFETTEEELYQRLAGHPNLGQLLTPQDGNSILAGLPYAVDNAAYSNWDEEQHERGVMPLKEPMVKATISRMRTNPKAFAVMLREAPSFPDQKEAKPIDVNARNRVLTTCTRSSLVLPTRRSRSRSRGRTTGCRWSGCEASFPSASPVYLGTRGKHGLSLGHEDAHGAFLVEQYSEGNIEWLMAAQDDTGAA